MLKKADKGQRTSPARYHLVSQVLHWVMAAILIYLIFFSSFEEASDTEMMSRIKLHSGLGALIVILGLVRWFWRITKPRPAPIENAPKWQEHTTEVVHHAFYVLFLISPALGLILAGLVAYEVRVFGFFDVSDWLGDNMTAAEVINSLHGLTADIFLILIIIHVAAALYHQFIKGDGLIRRMLPFG